MGIALACGVLVGARGALGGRAELALVVAVLLALLAALLRAPWRAVAVCGVLGCLLGLGCGHWRAGQAPQPYTGGVPSGSRGQFVSDPELSGAGRRAELRWTDPQGITRDWLAYLPAAPTAGRGADVSFNGYVLDPLRRVMVVTSFHVTSEPGQVERARQRLRGWLSATLVRAVPGSPGSLTLGLLVGDDSGLTSAERADMRQAGLSHITAVSGWNVSLVIGSIGGLCLALGLRGVWWALAQAGALCGYVWLVGAQPPVLRAAIMAAAALAAALLGRPTHTLNVLAMTTALLACVTPATLGTLSFQLSALATVGVAVAVQWTASWPRPLARALEPAAISACSGLATAPLLAAKFGTFTLAAVPANAVAGLLVSVATFAGLACVLLAPLRLAALPGSIAWLACAGVLRSAAWFAAAPFGHWTFAPLAAGTLAGIYGVLAICGALVTPEGRLARRRLSAWAQREPLPALAASITTLGVLALALATL